MIIILWRHGQIEQRYKNCYNGHIDINLDDIGIKQAKLKAKELEALNFDAIYCSTLNRARQTLAELTTDKKIVYTDELREKSWGRHEGKTYEQIIQNENFKYENFLQWINALDGEVYESYIQRVDDFFSSLKNKKYNKVLVVTHAGVIRVLMSLRQKISLEEVFSM